MSLTIDINKRYKNFALNIKIDTKGRSTGLLGASGCGKSLTLKCIAGIETPDSGKIILNDRILFDSERKINLLPKQRNVGYMFQNYALFPNMTVRENVEIAVKDKKNKKEKADKMLAMLHLEHLRNRYPGQLSGGEQQRTALARMMVYEPEVMLFDEPFSALDSFLKDKLQQELLESLKEYTGDIIMVSHSRDELYRFCESIVVINQGQMIETGDRKDIFTNPTDIATAKLTGCKNISRAVKVSDYEVKALDWNICLKTERLVGDDISFVGIRAHNIKACNDSQTVNSMAVSVKGFSEGPFENSLIVSNNTTSEAGILWWILTKNEWKDTLKGLQPSMISFPAEHLILLKDRSQSKK